MRRLTELFESIKELKDTEKGIIVFDIDDTLLRADSSLIKIYKRFPNGKEIALSTSEFAKDKDIDNPEITFDYRDFRDKVKVRQSILNGKPLIKNLRIMDSYINAGYDFCFLTARSCEDTVAEALYEFLRLRTPNGTLRKLRNTFKRNMSYAVNDETHTFPANIKDADRKSYVLTKLCKKYDKVVFVDDDAKNLMSARSLGLSNLKVIKAQ